MPEIGSWVLRDACREAATWPSGVCVLVNLSPSQFYLPSLADSIVDILTETGLAATRVELEVTETAMIADLDAAGVVLSKIRMLGITIALDEFGAGYSSLSFLRTLPFDRIKIDHSFVKDLGIKTEASAIVGSVIHLCAGLGAAVTGEGVENRRQIDLLRAAGCREVQGFGIGRPSSAAETRAWMSGFAASHKRSTGVVDD